VSKRMRIVLALVAAVLVLLPLPAALSVQGQERVSRLGEYSGYSQPVYTEWLRSSQYVAVRDGTKLAMDIFRPAQNGQPVLERLPVIWTHHRYHRADAPGGKLTTVLDQMPWLRTVLKYGYVVAAVDVRGSGASFGTRDGEMTRQEALDAYDITEWLAAQSWCSGNVGMYGLSYLGASQFMAASTRPPHLKAIFPEKSPLDVYASTYAGGVFRDEFWVGWSGMVKRLDRGGAVARVDEDTDGNLLRQALAQHLGNDDALQRVFSLPYRDSLRPDTKTAIYAESSVLTYLNEIRASRVPVYQLAGWFDAFLREDLVAFNNLDNPKKLVIGPWSHSDEKGLDQAAEHLRWYDYWLKGIDNGVMVEPPIHYYLMGAPPGTEWRCADQWPLPHQSLTNYYLQAGSAGTVRSANDGVLSTQGVTSTTGWDEYTADFTTTTGRGSRWTNAYGGPFHYPDLAPNDAKGLTYTTPPLTQDTELTGHPVAHLWITATSKSVDVFAYLEEVDEKGVSSYITEGVLRASHRALAPPPYEYMGLPYHRSFRSDVADLPPEPVELVIDLLPTSNLFDAGHRMRFTITCADKDNALTYVESPAPRVNVYRDVLRASYVVLPIILPVQPTPIPTVTRVALPTLTATSASPAPSPAPSGATPGPLESAWQWIRRYSAILVVVSLVALILVVLWVSRGLGRP